MKFCTLASGSSGNCAVIKSGDTAILIDAGISMRRIKQGLAETGLLPEDLSAILVTHCHTDHISGIKMMSKYYHLPILAPKITAGMISSACPEAGRVGLYGGIFAHSDAAREIFTAQMASLAPDAVICRLEYPPELGALIHLFRKHGRLDADVLTRMKSTYEEMRK